MYNGISVSAFCSPLTLRSGGAAVTHRTSTPPTDAVGLRNLLAVLCSAIFSRVFCVSSDRVGFPEKGFVLVTS